MWRGLGVDPGIAEELVALQLRIENGCLKVASELQHKPGVVGRVARVQLQLWQFRAWAESRWLSIGGRAPLLYSLLHHRLA